MVGVASRRPGGRGGGGRWWCQEPKETWSTVQKALLVPV